jgi:hypothetical protein
MQNINGFLNDKLRYVNTLSMLSSINSAPNLVTDKFLSLVDQLLSKLSFERNPEMCLKIFDAASRIGYLQTSRLFESIKETYKDVRLLKTDQIATLIYSLSLYSLSSPG